MKIYVPSRGRADRAFTNEWTAHWLQEHFLTYVVPMNEVHKYEARVSRLSYAGNINITGCPEDGIAATRRWIGENAELYGEKSFIMFDDDIRFYRRRTTEDWHLEKQTRQDTTNMLLWLEAALEEGPYAAASISMRQGNNRETGTERENTRLCRVLGFKTDEFLRCEHGRVTVMEDFDVLLQLLRRGLPNVMSVYYAQDQNQTQNGGGCQDYRTHENHEASARKLAELHDGYVRLRQKQNKTGGEFGTRTEVTISWKKAYDDGRAAQAGTPVRNTD